MKSNEKGSQNGAQMTSVEDAKHMVFTAREAYGDVPETVRERVFQPVFRSALPHGPWVSFFRDFGDLGLPGGVPVECQKVSKMNKIHPGASFSATVFWNALLRVTLAHFLVIFVVLGSPLGCWWDVERCRGSMKIHL